MMNLIDVLQSWYASQCDDAWEHSFGVEIANIDNPGWKVKITGATARKLTNVSLERSETDWITVQTTETEFNGYGGPRNLQELLTLAVDWIQWTRRVADAALRVSTRQF
ncbi:MULTISPECIES: immunity 53 family protein [unclassified Caballeronia]|uniref:immunity 53 family protein n=1 Tax=unclassified Caballeronia TaxID=2646786 RepID=UPI001F235E8E|nr:MULTISPECIES: immunity 53 family protein [unclassified Caballeronia]MCE4544322.1 immunity 53 family protein [Caballeronia sp. PC1]MCE4571474.1 immunity 53 family protein [Caballeronia sp. CLC5]